jgi:hypothetical protein
MDYQCSFCGLLYCRRSVNNFFSFIILIYLLLRTGEEGMNGISLLLLERDMPGIECRFMKMQGIATLCDCQLLIAQRILGKWNNFCDF